MIEKGIGVRDTEVNTDKITNLSGGKRDFQFSEEISGEDKNLFGELLDKDR